jgi:hypothetical protein
LAIFTAQNAISDYSAITGYTSTDPTSDQGTEVREALKYRQKVGLIDSKGKRHKIEAYIKLDNLNEVKQSIYLFSVAGIGIQFPESATFQFDNNLPWDYQRGSFIDGGHYVPVIGYDSKYLYCVTWGKIQPMTYRFYNYYCDEAWAILSREFLKNGKSLEGFDYNTLANDLRVI